MESPISLSTASHTSCSPSASERSESPSNVNVHDAGAEWGVNASNSWGQEQTGSWGHTYTSNWGTEYLTRSSVLQTSSLVQYTTSEQGRRDRAPFPSFTLPQVEQRYQEVQASIRTRLQQKELLAEDIEVLAQNLAEKKKKAKEIEDDLLSLKFTREELRDLHVIAHARLPMSGEQKKYDGVYIANWPRYILDRPKFKISLAEFLRKGLNAKDYAKYKPNADSQSRIRRSGGPKPENAWPKPETAWPNEGLLILKTRDISKRYMRNSTARCIAKIVGMAKIVVDPFVILKNGVQGLSPTIANVVMGVYNDPRTTQFKYLK
ncbi:hypothetical protein F5878DRAFT_646837 [Lentinula raphanica]|uniref:Uncharacterized protein n=1 Tax=Lentinula raphanica TaxID=153919 RepID=A0AA38U683_9AGAR|nr:hypothetical protein F5878DRAFT_646837 [Lentinula raphanica]